MQRYKGHLLNCPLPPTLAFCVSNVASVWMTAVVNCCGFWGFLFNENIFNEKKNHFYVYFRESTASKKLRAIHNI